MNQVSIFDKPADNNSVTMTSLELVAFINTEREAAAKADGVAFPSKGYAKLQNKDFLAKVPEVLGKERSAEFSADLPDSYGRPQPAYIFPKREACLMAMSYSYDLQAKVFDRMTALEAKAAAPAMAASKAASKLAASKLATAKTIESAQQQAKLSIAEPKADALDRIPTASEGSMGITNAAKSLQMQPNRLFAWLRANKWIYNRSSGSADWVGYQGRIRAGLVEHKVTPVYGATGDACYLHVLITAKGLAKLAVDFGKPLEAA